MWAVITIIFMCLLFIVPPVVIEVVDRRVKNVEKLSKHKPSIVRTINNDSNYKEYKRGETGFTTGRLMYKQFSNVEVYTYIEVHFEDGREIFVNAADLKWVEYCDANAKPYDNITVSGKIITYGYKYTEDDINKNKRK